MTRPKRNTRQSVEETDFDAARRALARNWPDLGDDSPKYQAFLELLADFHREFGAENFELRYNLRVPKDKVETWTKQHMHGQLSDEEFAGLLKADAERPIDLEMLTSVCDGYHENLAHYSAILQGTVVRPSMQHDTRAYAEQERSIDSHVAVLKGKLPVWKEHLETVFEFLDEIRLEVGHGLVTLGDFEATSAHWLAQLVFTRTIQGWNSCKEVAYRSQTDPRYLYSTRAADLFQEHWSAQLPRPQGLSERMRQEFNLARLALKRRVLPASPPSSANSVEIPGGSSPDGEIDNESREAILIGEVFKVVGEAGHIFRPVPNSDWGIDGEIEFKDDAGQACGKRVYVQLKSGDSHLTYRQRDNAEIFRIAKERQAQYWQQHAYPVMLVIRRSDGITRWMDVSAYLREHRNEDGKPVREVVFKGEAFDVQNIRSLRDRLPNPAG